MQRFVMILFCHLWFISLFGQANKPQIYTHDKGIVVNSRFEAAYGFFLNKYVKRYSQNQTYKSFSEVVNNLNERMNTTECSNIDFAKFISVKEPVQMTLYELHFKNNRSANTIENLLEKYPNGVLNTSIAPEYFVFTKVDKTIFFVSHTNDKNKKPLNALIHCLKTFKENELKNKLIQQ